MVRHENTRGVRRYAIAPDDFNTDARNPETDSRYGHRDVIERHHVAGNESERKKSDGSRCTENHNCADQQEGEDHERLSSAAQIFLSLEGSFS